MARALGIAAHRRKRRACSSAVEPGDAAIVDAEGGELHVRPTPEVVSAYSDKVRFRARRQAQYAALRTVPPVTLDGAAGVAQHQCRPLVRPAASRSVGRRRHRPVPHRAAIHDLGHLPAARAADPALQGDPRRGRRPAGGVPLARRRRRQGAALFPRRPGGEPGHRLARHPHGARPAGAVPHPDQGAAPGRRTAASSAIMLPMIADVSEFIAARALIDREVTDPQAARPARAEEADGRGHDRGAGAALAARRRAASGRFRLGRLERSDAVPVRRRPRQYARGRSASTRSIRRG